MQNLQGHCVGSLGMTASLLHPRTDVLWALRLGRYLGLPSVCFATCVSVVKKMLRIIYKGHHLLPV